MARKRSGPSVTPPQAKYILDRLIQMGRVTAHQVRGFLTDIGSEVRRLQERLTALRSAAGESATKTKRPTARRKGRQASRRKSVSPEVAKSRALQGRYIATIRQVPKSRRAKFAKIAKENGREEAIKQIQAALGK